MTFTLRLSVCFATALLVSAAQAQTSTDASDETNPDVTKAAPVAFVYVSNTTNPTVDYTKFKDNVYAYTAAADGRLTPVSGSPLAQDIFRMGVNGKYLFGGEVDGITIDTLLMEPDGSLKKLETTNTKKDDPSECGNPGVFKIDHSGTGLYNVATDEFCSATLFQYFKINGSTGALAYSGSSVQLDPPAFEIDFLGNNQYAYSPICVEIDHETLAGLYAFRRSSNLKLTELNIATPAPATRENGNFYCPGTFATDPTDHMAMLLQDEDVDGDVFGPPVIATYTTSPNGNISTTSTYKNMPAVAPGDDWMRMSPSGKLLAVGGTGLQILHFNGASPATKYKTLLPNSQAVWEFYWDNHDHLYVMGANAPGKGKLYVYTVTPTSVTEAPGSPYSIPNPEHLIVQSR